MEFVLRGNPDADASLDATGAPVTPAATPLKLSFILLDWSCRESFHMLDYLAEQSVPRDQYEIVWIEYYDRKPPELMQRIAAAEAAGTTPPVDTFCLMEMPRSAYYHKHLMYNLGLILAKGEIVCICDSDTMVGPNFVESILAEFRRDPQIVLHHDEVRNHSRDFYPFRYPTFEDVRGPGCSMVVDGRTLGIWDKADPLHTRNYGACLSARRSDLIAIGGADMHRDYLGHVCGPYELTFRLVNAGKEELWHPTEFLYHTWHPGEAGDNNYFGPHDGYHMSTTSLASRETRRVEPLEICPAIADLQADPHTPEDQLLARLIKPAWLQLWEAVPHDAMRDSKPHNDGWGPIRRFESEEQQQQVVAVRPPLPFARHFGIAARLRILPALCLLFWKQYQCKRSASLAVHDDATVGVPVHKKSLWRKVTAPLRGLQNLAGFMKRMWSWNRHLLRQCWIHLVYLMESGSREVVLYGDGDAARVLVALSPLIPMRIRAICPFNPDRATQFAGVESWDEKQLAASGERIVVATFTNIDRHANRLQSQGITRDRLVLMQ